MQTLIKQFFKCRKRKTRVQDDGKRGIVNEGTMIIPIAPRIILYFSITDRNGSHV